MDDVEAPPVLPPELAGLSPEQVAELEGLSPQDRRILPALAMRASGSTWVAAAASIGMSHSNLIGHAQRRGWYTADAAGKRDLLAGMAADIAIEGSARILEHVSAGEYGRNELVTVVGVLTDKLTNLRRVDLQAAQLASTTGDGVSRILERLADAGGGTLSVSPARPAIDVTPEG